MPQVIACAGEDVEQGVHSSIDDASTNLYSYYGNQYGGSSEICVSIYLKNYLCHCWACIQRVLHPTITVFIVASFIIARNETS